LCVSKAAARDSDDYKDRGEEPRSEDKEDSSRKEKRKQKKKRLCGCYWERG
jgi:hypothetical protein